MSDVLISSIQNNDIIAYNENDQKYVNLPITDSGLKIVNTHLGQQIIGQKQFLAPTTFRSNNVLN